MSGFSFLLDRGGTDVKILGTYKYTDVVLGTKSGEGEIIIYLLYVSVYICNMVF